MKHLREMQNLLQAEIEAATAKQLVLRQLALFADDLERQGFAVDVDVIGSQNATTVTFSVRMPDGAIPSAPAGDASDPDIDARIEEFDAPVFGINDHYPPDDIDAAFAALDLSADIPAGPPARSAEVNPDDPGVLMAEIADLLDAEVAMLTDLLPPPAPSTSPESKPPVPAVDDGHISDPAPVAPPRAASAKTVAAPPQRPARLIAPAEKSADWTPGMIARLRQLHAQKRPHAQIAREMGRTEKAIGLKITRLNAADRAAAVAADAPRPAPAPKIKHSPTEALAHRLDRMAGNKLWSMSLNLQLAVHAKARKTMTEIALLLGGGLTQEDVSNQLMALCPTRARPGALDELIAALRERVAV